MNEKQNLKDKPKAKKGFAAMDAKLVRKITSMGGIAVSKNRAHMREIGRAGGAAPRRVKATPKAA